MSVRYPIAPNAEAALKSPVGRAVREREALEAAGEPVRFVRELTGPEFETREAAEAAYAGRVDAPGQPAIQPEDRFCDLVEVIRSRERGGGQAEPTFEEGRRWPRPRKLLSTVWRLSVSYWKTGLAEAEAALPQARAARRSEEAQDLEPDDLRAIARQPLRPVKPQQPLDIGLFERRLPEAPDIIVPDE